VWRGLRKVDGMLRFRYTIKNPHPKWLRVFFCLNSRWGVKVDPKTMSIAKHVWQRFFGPVSSHWPWMYGVF
jgi:hypothetical protein